MSAATARQRLSIQLATDRVQRAEAGIHAQATHTLASGKEGTELYEWLTGGLRSSGVAVNERSAMCVSAVFAAVSLIGGAIAQLPLHIYKRGENGRERIDSDLWWLFNESPWPSWTSASAWEYIAMCVLLRGDGFMRIHRASRLSPTIVGFEPLLRDWVDPRKNGDRIAYVITRPDRAQEVLDQDDMLHIPGIGFNGLHSITPLTAALRNAVGIALAANESASGFFSGRDRSDLILSKPGKMDEGQQAQFRQQWDERNGGARNAKYPVILTGEWKVEQIGISAEDMQLLTTRQFQVEDIARAYGVPPHMIGKTDASTSWGSGIENMGRGFVTYTLNRHLSRITQEVNRKSWPRSRLIFAEFQVDALMAGDSKAESEYFSKALGGPGSQGWMLVNEVRKLKNLPPLDGGNELIKAGAKNETKPANQPAGE